MISVSNVGFFKPTLLLIYIFLGAAVASSPSQVATHLALSALFAFQASSGRFPAPGDEMDKLTMTSWVRAKSAEAGYKEQPTEQMDEELDEDVEPPLSFWDHVDNAVGEM